MIIFYTAAYSGKQKYQKYYDMVLHAIESTGVEVISPEKGNYLDVLSAVTRGKIKSERILHYEAIRKGILLSDAVVIEASYEDFQLGAEAEFAVASKRPLLCLSVNENFSDKMRKRYFKGAQYNKFNIEEIVEDFIDMVRNDSFSERFNCFLSPSQLSYLKRKAKANDMNVSEYLRTLIDGDRLV